MLTTTPRCAFVKNSSPNPRRTHRAAHGVLVQTASMKKFDRGSQEPSPSPSPTLSLPPPRPNAAAVQASVALPRTLPRPAFCEIKREALVAVDPDLAEIPLAYVRDTLKTAGTQMLRAVANTKMKARTETQTYSGGALPKEMEVSFGESPSADTYPHRPTHLFAVHASAGAASHLSVTLVPAHNIVFATHCAHMPPVPSPPPPANANANAHINTLSVVPICLPSPASFRTLQHYLYTKHTGALLSALLLPPAAAAAAATAAAPRAPPLSAQPLPALLHIAARIRMFWRTVCALGVSDDGLWTALDFAWAAVLHAIARATSRERSAL